jgi:hypothetical protein
MTWYQDWFVILMETMETMETLDYLPFSKARVGAELQKSCHVNASLPGLGQIISSIDSGIIRLVLGIVPKLF